MTVTHRQRVNRPDGRARGAKYRTTVRQKQDAAKSIQDLRITRVQKNERKERTINTSAMPLREGSANASKTKDEKLIRALKKKLRSMEPLIAKQAAGELLTEDQLYKLEGLDDILASLAEITDDITSANISRKKT